jgi:hypothetical protein
LEPPRLRRLVGRLVLLVLLHPTLSLLAGVRVDMTKVAAAALAVYLLEQYLLIQRFLM